MYRIGHGYDVHRFEEGRRLVLGGVTVPYEKGLLGHSDADVLCHAVSDALLAPPLWAISGHFPDTDESFKDADSIELLKTVVSKLKAKGFSVVNIDATIIAQRPKLANYIDSMVNNIAAACCLQRDRVNVKATTEEGLGFTGAMLGIAAHAVCLIEKTD